MWNKDQSIVAACTVHLYEDVWVADDNQQGLGSCDGHVEPLRVAEETQSMPFIKTHQILIGTHLHKTEILLIKCGFITQVMSNTKTF